MLGELQKTAVIKAVMRSRHMQKSSPIHNSIRILAVPYLSYRSRRSQSPTLFVFST
jgi:hypothetical protein